MSQRRFAHASEVQRPYMSIQSYTPKNLMYDARNAIASSVAPKVRCTEASLPSAIPVIVSTSTKD